MSDSKGNAPSLTRNQTLVLDVLLSSNGALSAYDILDQLRGQGLKAPLQVYRALEKLTNMGKVHRLESINAFIACCERECSHSDAAAFTICENCGDVDEVSDEGLLGNLMSLAARTKFEFSSTAVELRGICAHCRSL